MMIMIIITITDLQWYSHKVALHPLFTEVLIFVKGGKLEYPEKTRRAENQQQTQSTYDAGSGN